MDWSAFASAGSSLIGSIVNLFNQERTNESNRRINQNNLDYQRATTQAAWERDDTYYQRSVADAEAAGLSPLAINGAMPNTAPLGAPNPIAMQAPQIDTNSLVQAVLGSAQLEEESRHNKEEEKLRGEEIYNSSKELELKSKSLDIENKKVEADIKYQVNLIKLEDRKIAETIRANKASEDLKEKQYNLEKLSYQTKRYYEELSYQLGGEKIPYKKCYSLEELETENEIYNQKLSEYMDSLSPTRSASAKSKGGNAGGSAAGTGLNIGANVSEYEMKDWSEWQKISYKEFIKSTPKPILWNDDIWKDF